MDTCNALFDQLERAYGSLGSNARSIVNECNRLASERDRMEEYANSIRERLHFFDDAKSAETDIASSLPPKSMPKQHALQNALSRVEDCADFVDAHPSFAESSEYTQKTNNLRMKALASIKRLLTENFRNAAQACARVLAERYSLQVHERRFEEASDILSEAQESEAIHVTFRAHMAEVGILSDTVASRVGYRREYNQLARAIASSYCEHRSPVVVKPFRSQLLKYQQQAEEQHHQPRDLVHAGCSLLARFLSQEHTTFVRSLGSENLFNAMRNAFASKREATAARETPCPDEPLEELASQLRSELVRVLSTCITKHMPFEKAASTLELLQSDVFASPLTHAALAHLAKRANAAIALSLLQMQLQDPGAVVDALCKAKEALLPNDWFVAVAQNLVCDFMDGLLQRRTSENTSALCMAVTQLSKLWHLRARLHEDVGQDSLSCHNTDRVRQLQQEILSEAKNQASSDGGFADGGNMVSRHDTTNGTSSGVLGSIVRFIQAHSVNVSADKQQDEQLGDKKGLDDDVTAAVARQGEEQGQACVDVLEDVQSRIRQARETLVVSATRECAHQLLSFAGGADEAKAVVSELESTLEHRVAELVSNLEQAMHRQKADALDVSEVLLAVKANLVEALGRAKSKDGTGLLPEEEGFSTKLHSLIAHTSTEIATQLQNS